jgi:hypothetical protein
MVTYMSEGKTTIQVTEATRDRLYKLKFRRTYDQFLNELCDLYEEQEKSVTSVREDR